MEKKLLFFGPGTNWLAAPLTLGELGNSFVLTSGVMGELVAARH